MRSEEYDVVVVGAGASGTVAALTAAKSGARVALVDAAPFPGGELVCGLPLDSVVNPRGEWIQGGVLRDLFDRLDAVGGLIGPVFDWRTMYAVCVDPELFKLIIIDALGEHGVTLRLQHIVEVVGTDGAGRVTGLETVSRSGRTRLTAPVVIDASGDADVVAKAGGPTEKSDASGMLQPISLVYRLSGVDFGEYMSFVRDHPEEFLLAENPIIGLTPAEAAQKSYEIGLPHVALSCDGPLLKSAIDSGEMYPCTFVFTWPTSVSRGEVGLNTTRIAGVDATDTAQVNAAWPELMEQVRTGLNFCRSNLPGYGRAEISAIAPRPGIRETRRIIGEARLADTDVIEGRKLADGVAKGSHHVDIHGAGTDQLRIPVADGGSYDIGWGTLLPKQLSNVLVAGRCLSSERGANGSARVMGSCVGMGQAVGLAGALIAERGLGDVRDLPVTELRAGLTELGAVLDGTH
ncbi:FAD-dependent oxidoreductase [Microlunatus sp. Y2014]|uniref:FAD-dependent oxidoreductase n=1 Tax=Microlunatus sp. Y2014 TaxID=3418488 RepID=UPI003DA6DDA0